MKIRLPIPYATKTKGRKELRIGVAGIEIREIPPEDAPVVAVQTDTYQYTYDDDDVQETDFRLVDGQFYAPYRKDTLDSRKYPFSTLADIPDANRLDAHEFLRGWQLALESVPYLPDSNNYAPLLGNVSSYSERLVPDTVDDAPALLKSKSWAHVSGLVDDAILVDGAIYAKSIGPAFHVWHQDDGSVKIKTRSAASRYHPGSFTRMAWDRERILAEFDGKVTAEDLDRHIRFAEGIDPKSLDTGYDTLALALENMAWSLLNEAHSNSAGYASDKHMKATLDLRKAIVERMPEAEALFGPRYPANPRRWDAILPDPGKACELMPLIDNYRSAHWVNGSTTGQIEELKRAVERAEMSDEAVLANAFG